MKQPLIWRCAGASGLLLLLLRMLRRFRFGFLLMFPLFLPLLDLVLLLAIVATRLRKILVSAPVSSYMLELVRNAHSG